MSRIFLVLACLLVFTAAGRAQDEDPFVFLEIYPAELTGRVKRAERLIHERWVKAGRPEAIVVALRLWKPGSTVTVAFRGGSDDRCAEIAAVADRWSAHGNVQLSFRTADGAIRRWSADDKQYAADVRVDLDAPVGDYMSLVGTQSRDLELIGPGKASMALGGFARMLPPLWEGTVLHEFGHALGFEHEHQHPDAPCDFLMEDDLDYEPTRNAVGRFIEDARGRRPGIYRRLSGPPYRLPKEEVDFNFKKLKVGSSMYLVSDFDPDSIMKYDQPAWYFVEGEESACYTGRWKRELSKMDKEMMGKAYPKSAKEIRELEERIRKFRVRHLDGGGGNAAQGDEDAIEGAWDFTRLRNNGRDTPAEQLGGSQLVFADGRRFTFSVGPLTTMHGTYELNPNETPSSIDLLPTSGPFRGKRLLGVYRVEGNQLTLGYAEPGLPRPEKLEATAGTRVTLITLTRKVKAC